MKQRSLLSQTIHTLTSILLGQGAMIAAGIAISRVYGPAGKGVVSYAGIAIMAFIAIGEGLSSAVARTAGQDSERAASAYVAARRIVVIVSALASPIIALVGWFVPSQHALLAVAIALPFALYLQTMNAFHLINLRVERTNVASLATNAGTGIAMLLAMATRHVGIDGILTIWVVGYVSGALIVARGLHQLARDAVPAEVSRSFGEMVRFSRMTSLSSIAAYLSFRVDVFIVSALLTPIALGNYTLAIACGELMFQVSRAISWSAYGRVAIASFEEGAAITARITRLVIAIEVVSAVVAFVLGPWLVTLVYGSAFAQAGIALRYLLPGMTVYAADAILTYFLSVRANRPALVLRIEFVTLTLCALVTFATVGRYGIIGPAIATTLAYLFSFGAKISIFARLTKTPIRDLFVARRDDFAALRGSPPIDAAPVPVL